MQPRKRRFVGSEMAISKATIDDEDTHSKGLINREQTSFETEERVPKDVCFNRLRPFPFRFYLVLFFFHRLKSIFAAFANVWRVFRLSLSLLF